MAIATKMTQHGVEAREGEQAYRLCSNNGWDRRAGLNPWFRIERELVPQRFKDAVENFCTQNHDPI